VLRRVAGAHGFDKPWGAFGSFRAAESCSNRGGVVFWRSVWLVSFPASRSTTHGSEFGAARAYLIGGGVIYLVLFLSGLLVGQESAANFVPVNTAMTSCISSSASA
jgi:Domain of unknown function (DUF4383)